MKSIPLNLGVISLFVILILGALSCDGASIKHNELHDVIEKTPFIDVHSHPAIGHRSYSDRDPSPTLEPLIGRRSTEFSTCVGSK
jgi:hypothetical protein